MSRVDHLSASQVSTFLHCSERWRLKKIEKLTEPSSSTQIRGTQVHAATAANMISKRDSLHPLAIEQIEALAWDGTHNAFSASAVLLTEEESLIGVDAVARETADVAMWMARVHAVQLAPGIQPVSVEETITVTAPGLPPMVAILDLTDTDDVVHDLKTKTRAPSPDEAHKSSQLSQYHLSFAAKNGRPPSRLQLDHLVYRSPSGKNPQGKVEPIIQETTRSREQLDAYLERVAAVHRAIEAGITIPADVNSTLCSPRYCGFFGNACKYTRGQKIGGTV